MFVIAGDDLILAGELFVADNSGKSSRRCRSEKLTQNRRLNMLKRLQNPVPEPTWEEFCALKKKHHRDWYLLWPLSPVLMFLQRLFGKKCGIPY